MREITKDKKIQASSLEEIRKGLRDEAERLGNLGMKGTTKISVSAYLLNWCVCYVLSKSPTERLRMAQEGKAILDAHRASKDPILFPPSLPRGMDSDDALPLAGYVAQGEGKPKRADRPIAKKRN